MKRYMDKDMAAGLFLIALGAIYYFMADAIPRSLLSDRVGADGFPKLLAVGLMAFSAVLVIQSLLRNRVSSVQHEEEVRQEEGDGDGYKFRKAAGMLSIGIAYLLIVSFAGYVVSIALLLTAALLYQGEPVSKKMLLTAVLGGVFFWVFFVIALRTPMPAGIWSVLLAGK